MTITIESVIKLDTNQQVEIEKLLSKKIGGATFSYKINKDILGGLRVTMGGERIDLSLAGKVNTLRKKLL
ncbi:MAG: F0F1 ATP synthase subunit delta [Candidatus Woesebacteria bacterium]